MSPTQPPTVIPSHHTVTLSPRIRRSPFYAATVREGVTHFTVYNKMLMPLSFGDLKAEYRRLMEGVAMWDVAVERQVEVMGPDAHALAQAVSARDLSTMKAGQGKYVAMCDHTGRLLNDPVLLKLQDRYWFSLADSDMLLWVRAIAAERGLDVTVQEPDVSPLAIQGPLAEKVVAKLFGNAVSDIRYFGCVETHLHGIPLVLCRSGWSKQGGFELFLQDANQGDALWELVKDAGQAFNIGPGAPNHIERVESGLLSWGGDTTPDTNPFEANMDKFVDIDGVPDYIGKAALQRIVREGVQRKMVGLIIEGPELSAWPLVERVPVLSNAQQVGTMSAVVYSPRLGKTIGLAQVMRHAIDSHAPLLVETPTGPREATVAALPFI
jgi:glycine cleavage system aminomethyltransferase T